MLSREKTFRTLVGIPKMERAMQLGDSFVFLGSCFAEHMGSRLAEYGLPVLCNPFGVLYNPQSLLMAVQGAVDEGYIPQSLFQREGAWYSWAAGTQVFANDKSSACRLMDRLCADLRGALSRASFLFVTLGTRVCYRLRQTGMVVANCHKMPSSLFEAYALGVEEATNTLAQLVDTAHSLNPNLQIVFTVSPYRYAKYGYHGNQLSKAVLLLGCEAVCQSRAHCTYLPVYEIFMDELRDYRFYAEDMLHPAPAGIDYVWSRLKEECMDALLQVYLEDYEPLRRALAHRPSDPDSPLFQAFQQRTEALRDALMAKYKRFFPNSENTL